MSLSKGFDLCCIDIPVEESVRTNLLSANENIGTGFHIDVHAIVKH